MSKFRKKPVVVEAARFLGGFSYDEMCEEWGEKFSDNCSIDGLGFCKIRTLEGTMGVSNGDWIIKGTANEFYPCKDEIFKKIYEPVEEK